MPTDPKEFARKLANEIRAEMRGREAKRQRTAREQAEMDFRLLWDAIREADTRLKQISSNFGVSYTIQDPDHRSPGLRGSITARGKDTQNVEVIIDGKRIHLRHMVFARPNSEPGQSNVTYTTEDISEALDGLAALVKRAIFG